MSAGLRDGERIYPVQYSCKTANTNLELISNILQNTTHKICLLTAKKKQQRFMEYLGSQRHQMLIHQFRVLSTTGNSPGNQIYSI
jgi:hypothetical protein